MKNKIKISKAVTIESKLSSSPLRFYGSQGNTPSFYTGGLTSDNENLPKHWLDEYVDQKDTKNDTSSSDEDDGSLPTHINHEPTNKAALAINIVSSLLVSGGTACAMMPIFNYLVRNSKELGIDVHDNQALFITSTVNTFIVTAISSFGNVYHHIDKLQHGMPNHSNGYQILFKIGAGFSIVLPIGLLWGIETHNQKVAGSSGFDEFIAWAAFTTIPLIINNTIESIRTVDKFFAEQTHKVHLDSVGSKLAVYGLTLMSLAGRAIAYTQAAKTLCEIIGIDETVSLGIGIAAGGIVGSSGVALFEHEAVKSLFIAKEPITAKKVFGGLCSTIEGAWFSLPTLALGLKFAEGWNPLLKGLLFTPVVISSTTYGASKLYDNIATSFESITNFCSSGSVYDVETTGSQYDYGE